MESKHSEVQSFLEPETSGFIYDTARSFLKKHSNPDSLLAQLKSLIARGELSSCHDLIHLILREGHPLSNNSQIYLLRAQIAFEQSDSLQEVMAWVQQAKLAGHKCDDVAQWDQLMVGVAALKDGDYELGMTSLEKLVETYSVSTIARYYLAHHYFWKNINAQKALIILEELCEERPGFLQAKSCLGFVYGRLGMKTLSQDAFAYCLKRETNPDRIEFYKQQLAS